MIALLHAKSAVPVMPGRRFLLIVAFTHSQFSNPTSLFSELRRIMILPADLSAEKSMTLFCLPRSQREALWYRGSVQASGLCRMPWRIEHRRPINVFLLLPVWLDRFLLLLSSFNYLD